MYAKYKTINLFCKTQPKTATAPIILELSLCPPSTLNFLPRCITDTKVSRVAWLNRTTILFAGQEKWSLDPRIVLLNNTPITEYSIRIRNVDVRDEGPYVCSILTNRKPKSSRVHLIVQGQCPPAPPLPLWRLEVTKKRLISCISQFLHLKTYLTTIHIWMILALA